MPLREVAAGNGKEGNEEAKVDIFAVHGLNPWGNPDHAFDTWRKPKGADGSLWLRDELPKTLPNARIFLYQYDSSPAFGSSKERFVHQANDLLERIHIKRTECSNRPILLLGHSLGGILIKQALVNAHSNTRYRPIKEATSGLVFFGTPHAGGKDGLVSIGKISAKVASSIMRNPSKDVMEALTKGSLFSDVLQESWRHQLNLYKIVSFYEGIGDIVPRDSAVLGLSGDVENQVRLEADHGNVCCFDQSVENDVDNYEVVAANIKELYEASAKRPAQRQDATTNSDLESFMSAMKAQGAGNSIKFDASYIQPNSGDYESADMDYATALNNDVKRTALHVLVLRDKAIILQGSTYGTSGAPVNCVNSNNDNPFHTAATLGRGSAWARFFLQHNVQINAKNNQGNTVLHLYMSVPMDNDERAAVVALILQHRPAADVNIKNREHFDPLALAVLFNSYIVIGQLIKAGANLTGPVFQDGNTILHYAAFLGRIACTQLLVAAGAAVNCTSSDGTTPLILAAKAGHKAIVNVLLDEGADIERRNGDDLGPVEMAAKEGNLECLQILVERRARLRPPEGSHGPSALQLAREKGDDKVVDFLLAKGG